MFKWLRAKFAPHSPLPVAKKPGISLSDLLRFSEEKERVNIFRPYQPARGVVPEGAPKIAMDDASVAFSGGNGIYSEGLTFFGYPLLAEMAQRVEYRKPSEIIAKEMCREWIKFSSISEEDESEKIAQIEAEFERLNVREIFRTACEKDGQFGRCHIFVDTGNNTDAEVKTRLIVDRAKIAKGGIKGLRVVEPMWTYPSQYNSTNPLAEDWYLPTSWYVMGREIHATRLLTFISRPVSDILKPAYAFGGLSLSQMIKPYVDNWVRTRQSVSDMLHTYSVSGLKTDMSTILGGEGAAQLIYRAQLFNQARDNRGLMMVNKDSEEYFNVSAPLGTLDKLQAQAQEQQASAAGIPLIVLLKITPSGLNASSAGEIEAFQDWIRAQQESDFRPHLQTIFELVQLSLFGEIDSDLRFAFEPLKSMTPLEQSTIRKNDADSDVGYINAGVLSPEEVRERLAGAEDSPYSNLDVEEVPVMPEVDATVPDSEAD